MLAQSRRLHRTVVRALSTSAASQGVVSFSHDSQDALVNYLVQNGVVRTPGVELVLRAVDRRDFTATHWGLPAQVLQAYSDSQVAIGQGQTISSPSLHAEALELLAGHALPGAAAMDVGAGSGYVAACLSLMVGPSGRVVALERHQRLVEHAGWVLARTLSVILGGIQQHAQGGQPRDGVTRVRVHNIELCHGNVLDEVVLSAAVALPADAGREQADAGPAPLFDAIHVGATARQVPPQLAALLRPGGRMVLALGPPVGLQTLSVVDKAADGSLSVSPVREVKLPPLAPPNAERPL
ncbi:hypothetical protein HYH03_004195 [Edaphochlamys debaryana]|uniref:protein-L-isoaspartate(D-aspartate) O-methyltransferase n=1 Tax=Edaphochlamys debaryana TaxID=47281 RepID=A0A835YAX3_9CHLO|nr:hypothetical protein HYH03_004195 [Edaphochlamys debaryana]|eukprot:KAG2497933.1 hypothetical protein HYH03_004195 [Edaphochlamys debaryana]